MMATETSTFLSAAPKPNATALSPSLYPAYAAECGDPSRTKVLGFGSKPALLLLDVCEAFFSPDSPAQFSQETLSRMTSSLTKLIQAARSSPLAEGRESVPVLFAQTRYRDPELRDAGYLARKSDVPKLFLVPSAKAGEVIKDRELACLTAWPSALEAVGPDYADDIVLFKKYPSPFFGTNFAAQLTALGVDTLVIAGCLTSSGIRHAVTDAMQAGFRAMIVGSACGDRKSEIHFANLFDLNAKYGDVVTEEVALEKLGSGWAKES